MYPYIRDPLHTRPLCCVWLRVDSLKLSEAGWMRRRGVESDWGKGLIMNERERVRERERSVCHDEFLILFGLLRLISKRNYIFFFFALLLIIFYYFYCNLVEDRSI